MEKTFVIMEVESDTTRTVGFRPVGRSYDDQTLIDPRHVIDGDRLRYGVPQGETAFQDGEYIGFEENTYSNRTVLILDPPKPEGDEWKPDYDELMMWMERFEECLAGRPRKP